MKFPRGRATAIFAALVVVLGWLSLGAPAQAYEVATNQATLGGGTAVLTMPGSNLTATYSGSGLSGVVGRTTMGSRGYVPSDFSQGLPGTTHAVEFWTNATNNCPVSGSCSGLGTVTVAFSQPVRNPVLNLAGLGGYVNEYSESDGSVLLQSQYHVVLNLATTGLTMSKLSGGNLAVSGNSITAVNDNTGHSCNTTAQNGNPTPLSAQATAACGSVRVEGVVTTLTFNVSSVHVPTSSSIPGYTDNNVTSENIHNKDNYVMAVTVPQDFGDAPASYDNGNAARAATSDVTLGANITEDNANVANGTTSPNASATAALDQMDDGVVMAPMTAGVTSYSRTVAISGASKAGMTCGWIDVNKDGLFNNTAERACATFAAGATSATLTWSAVPAGITAGTTYARFRIGYNTTQTQVPIGPSNSGEVEDYIVTIAPAAAPAITLVKTVDRTTLVAGQTATYTFVAQNTGNVTLTGVVISETQFSGTGTLSALSYTWPGLPGVLLAGQSVTATANYVVTQSDVTTGVLTNTAMVAGNPPTGPPVTATDDVEVKAPPVWTIKKTATVNGSVPANGSVTPGQTINYAVTATSLSGIITGVTLNDNLADVLDDATYVPGSATLTIGTGTPVAVADPIAPSTTLTTAAFTLPAGQTATLHYSVTVKTSAWNATLVNTVTGSGSTPPQTCAASGSSGPGTDCTTTHVTPAKVLIEKVGESSEGEWVRMAGSSWTIYTDNGGVPGAALVSPTAVAVAGETGLFQLEGIKPGIYWLEETTAPEGFNLLAEPVQFTVAANGAVTVGQGSGTDVVTSSDNDGDGIFLITVRDVPALQMPESGGIGWWPFTAAGSLLLLTALGLGHANVRRRNITST